MNGAVLIPLLVLLVVSWGVALWPGVTRDRRDVESMGRHTDAMDALR